MDPDPDASDANLWAASLRGDGHAFGQIFDRHYRPVLAYCVRIVADRASAEDLASLVFLEAWRLRRKVALEPDSSIRPWLLGIATNLSRNANRAFHRYSAFLARLPAPENDEPAESTATARIERVARRARLQQAMDLLPPPEKLIVELCDLQEQPHEQVAAHLGMSVRSLRRHLAAARTRVREELADHPATPAPPTSAPTGPSCKVRAK